MITQFRERMATNCPQVSSEKLVIHQIKGTKQSIMTAGASGNVPGGSELVSLNMFVVSILLVKHIHFHRIDLSHTNIISIITYTVMHG